MYIVNTCMLYVARYAIVTYVLTMTNVHYPYNNRCLFSQVKNNPWIPWVYTWSWHCRKQYIYIYIYNIYIYIYIYILWRSRREASDEPTYRWKARIVRGIAMLSMGMQACMMWACAMCILRRLGVLCLGVQSLGVPSVGVPKKIHGLKQVKKNTFPLLFITESSDADFEFSVGLIIQRRSCQLP
jgi:hypothetical protein